MGSDFVVKFNLEKAYDCVSGVGGFVGCFAVDRLFEAFNLVDIYVSLFSWC